jgi:ATP-dependent helicase/nuclease subunit B
VPYENGLLVVKMKGFADRIDRFDGVIRITDYKTGKVNAADLKFPSVEELFLAPKYEKAMQLLFYCWSYARVTGETHVNAGIFPLKHPSAFYMGLHELEGATVASIITMLDSFEVELLKVCGNLLNRELPFNQTDDPDICRQCAFHPICLTPLE